MALPVLLSRHKHLSAAAIRCPEAPGKVVLPSPCLLARLPPHSDSPLPIQLCVPVPTLSHFKGWKSKSSQQAFKALHHLPNFNFYFLLPPRPPPPKLSTHPPLTIGFPSYPQGAVGRALSALESGHWYPDLSSRFSNCFSHHRRWTLWGVWVGRQGDGLPGPLHSDP